MMDKEAAQTTFATVLFLWLGHFFVDFMLGVWPVYKTMSGLDLAAAGAIAAGCAFLGEGTQLLFGSLCDKGYKKRLVLLGLLFTGANGLLILTQSYIILFCFFLITCIGSGAFHPAATSLIGSLTEHRKSFFISVFASGGALGMALSQITFSKLLIVLENNIIFIVVPSLLLILFLLFFGFFKKESVSQKKESFNIKNIKNFFKNKELRLLYINQVCNQTIAWAAIFLLPDILVSRGYNDTIAFGGGHFSFIVGSAIMMIPSGYLADKYSSQRVMLIATFIGLIFFYAFLFFPNLESLPLLSILFVMGATIGVIQPVAVAFGNIVCKSKPGMVSAFLMGLVWCVSECLGPAGGGLLTKLFVDDAPAKALSVIGVLFFVSLYATALLPRKTKDVLALQENIANLNANSA